MNAWPTSAPITSKSSQYDFDARSSRHSFASSHRKTGGFVLASLDSGERKEDLLDATLSKLGVRAQLVERPLAGNATTAQQHEAVADSSSVRQLVDRQKQRAPRGRVVAQHAHRVARLSEIEAVEGLVEHQQRLRRQEADGEHDPAVLPFRELVQTGSEQRLQRKRSDDVVALARPSAMEPGDEPQDPLDRLAGPRMNALGQKVEQLLSSLRLDRLAPGHHAATRCWRHTGHTAEQRRLAGPVRANESEDFAGSNRERRALQRPVRAVALGEVQDMEEVAREHGRTLTGWHAGASGGPARDVLS